MILQANALIEDQFSIGKRISTGKRVLVSN